MNKKDKILISATNIDFLLNYKSGISQNFLKNGYEVTWNSPITEFDKNKIDRIPKKIKYNLWISPRKGIYVFIRMFFSYCSFILKNKKGITLISHTVYSNLASIISFFLLRNKNLKLIIFISGFGPSRIRNSLRVRLLGRIYLAFLRSISMQKNILIVTLNFKDKNLVQDFTLKRRVILCKEAGITKNDIRLGEISSNNKLKKLDQKILSIGFFGRFLLEKGIEDYRIIIETAKEQNLKFNFFIGGTEDKYNSSSVLAENFFKDYDDIQILKNPKYSDFFEKIDILIFPSYREGHPFYLLRSMAFGIVPLIYPNPGLSVDILDQYNGIVSKYAHPKSIMRNIMELNNNRELLSKLSKNAREYSLKKNQSQEYRDLKIFEKLKNFID